MTDQTATRSTDNAFCLACGYSLRELPAPRCPECGRPFDPADPRTMSLGQPLRPWQRWLLRPTGWRVIALAVLGTAALAYLSRWPRLSPEPPSVLLDEFHWPRPYTMPPTAPDVLFYAAVVLWAGFIGWTLFWQIARLLLVPRAGRRANVSGINTRRHRAVISVVAILSILCMIFGWQQRVGRRWIVRAMTPVTQSTQSSLFADLWRESPVNLSDAQAVNLLDHLIVDLPSGPERIAALGLLTQDAGRGALPSIVRAAETESDETVLTWEIRLIGVCRDSQTAQFLITRLHDPRPAIRAAAADSIGILRRPSYPIFESLDTQPPIDVGGIVPPGDAVGDSSDGGQPERGLPGGQAIGVEPSARATLEAMMLTGATELEREAAARALVEWPPEHYQLRVAEWGVWVDDKGNMALARKILDEIPPFAHRTGNPLPSFADYFVSSSNVTKPVIHLTSDVALAVDLEVHIREGRPWFAYPKPDDFGIGLEPEERSSTPLQGAAAFTFPQATSPPAPDDFDAPPIPSLADCREGYPWLLPHHRPYPAWQGMPAVFRLGVRWQSLIVSPKKTFWAVLPPPGSDSRFSWWDRLREVPSCWVTSRGETERFVYYDGPTRATVPVRAALEDSGRRVRFTSHLPDSLTDERLGDDKGWCHGMQPTSRPDLPEHEGLYIQVHAGQVRACAIEIAADGSVPLNLDPALTGEAAVAGRLRAMLVRYGLTGPEADGLIAAWAPQFFRAEGRRFVLRMSPAEYARQCPMQVRPTPTEVVRLGLVLTEFDPPPATRPAHQ